MAVQNLLAGASAAEAAKGINKGDDDGNSALHWAARENRDPSDPSEGADMVGCI